MENVANGALDLIGLRRTMTLRYPGADYSHDAVSEANWDVVERLTAFCDARGRSLLELAMSWLASRPPVASIIAGATSPDQVERNARAVDWQLTAEDLTAIEAATQRRGS